MLQPNFDPALPTVRIQFSGARGMRYENGENHKQPKADREQDNPIDCRPYDKGDRLPAGVRAWSTVIAREAGEAEVDPLIESRSAARTERSQPTVLSRATLRAGCVCDQAMLLH